MGLRVLKLLGFTSAAFVIFMVSAYYYGPMYGGRQYQKEALRAGIITLLQSYQRQQALSMESQHKFDLALHLSEQFKVVPEITLALNNDPLVKRLCSQCEVTEKSYKIAAIGITRSERVLYTIDDKGVLEVIPVE